MWVFSRPKQPEGEGKEKEGGHSEDALQNSEECVITNFLLENLVKPFQMWVLLMEVTLRKSLCGGGKVHSRGRRQAGQ